MGDKFNKLLCGLILILSHYGLAPRRMGPLYAKYCQQCHGAQREGGVGPSLVDGVWNIGQPSTQLISQVIREGSVNKAMPAWGQVLTSAEIDASPNG